MVTALLPVTSLSYDPVNRCIVHPPKPDVSMLTGYKGQQFMEIGCVYAPYIPRFKTLEIQIPLDPDLLAYTKTAYPTAFR